MTIKRAYDIERFINKLHIHSLDMIVWYGLREYLNRKLPGYYKKQKAIKQKAAALFTQDEVIVSLTTYPKRMRTLPLVLESIFHQSVAPTRVILWLADNLYTDKSRVTNDLKNFINRGLEIRFCEDLRAHKKYYYTMKEYPKALVITVDDDILYPEDMIEKLLATYRDHPDCIVTCRAHEMRFKDGKPVPYSQWNMLAKNCKGPSLSLCATGGAGCLYPPGCLSEHVFDKDVFSEICFYADDLWMKCMSFLNKTKVVLTEMNNPEIITVKITDDDGGLAIQNVVNRRNDEQLKAVSERYGIVWERV